MLYLKYKKRLPLFFRKNNDHVRVSANLDLPQDVSTRSFMMNNFLNMKINHFLNASNLPLGSCQDVAALGYASLEACFFNVHASWESQKRCTSVILIAPSKGSLGVYLPLELLFSVSSCTRLASRLNNSDLLVAPFGLIHGHYKSS